LRKCLAYLRSAVLDDGLRLLLRRTRSALETEQVKLLFFVGEAAS
jgi:hypothetical protein